MVNSYKKIPIQVRASLWFLLCTFMQKGISFITTPIFTRLLTSAEYGQYSVFNSWLGIITVFVSLNLYSGVYSQGLVKFEERKKEYSSSLQGLTVTLVIGWTVVYLIWRSWWNNIFGLTTIQMLAMLLMIWATAVFNFWATEQRVDFKYIKLVIITIIISIMKPVISIIFILHAEDKVTARILGLAITECVGYVGLYISQRWRGKKFYSKEFWKYALLFNIPLIPHYLSTTVLNSADRIMISNMAGKSEAGIYNLSYSVSQIMILFNSALLQTLEPWLFKKIKSKRINDITQIAYPCFVVVAFLNLLLIAFAPEIVKIFAPTSYYDAIWIIPPVSMSVYFMFIYRFFSVFEFYYEMTNYITISTIAGAIINVLLNYAFIKKYGYFAAGYTTLICYMIYAICHYMFMRKICKNSLDNQQPYSTKILIGITSIFMLCGFAFLIVYNNLIVRYCFVLIIIIVGIVFRKKITCLLKSIITIKKGKGQD